MSGQPKLWFDRWMYLDPDTYVDSYTLPPNEYLPFGNAQGVLFTVEYASVGAGAASVTLEFRRSSAPSGDSSKFEAMNTTPIPLSRTRTTFLRAFGADGTAGDKYPRGIGTVYVENSHATDWAVVHLRVWYALQE